jgi:iron-sulfur cluster insertion protein
MDNQQIFNFTFTDSAQLQYFLIKENDFTLQGKELRLHIDSKGCDGFSYTLGFDSLKEDDLSLDFDLTFQGQSRKIKIIIDKFTAFYCNNIIIDFQQRLELNEEGFIVTNLDQDKFKGKFYKDQPQLVPNL